MTCRSVPISDRRITAPGKQAVTIVRPTGAVTGPRRCTGVKSPQYRSVGTVSPLSYGCPGPHRPTYGNYRNVGQIECITKNYWVEGKKLHWAVRRY